MQSIRMGQTVIALFTIAAVTSCAATKEYTSKLFTPRETVKDSQEVALKFLDIETRAQNDENWVNTDKYLGRDSINKSLALDDLSETFPSKTNSRTDSLKTDLSKSKTELANKPVPKENEPVARHLNQGETRTKRIRE